MRLPSARRLLAAAAVTSLAALGAVALPPAGAGAAGNFTIYHAPAGLSGSNDAGEPSIGSNWATGNAMYQAGLSTYRVAFNDATGTATWTDKSSTLTSITSLDPILFTDHNTNRTFVSQLDGACSLMAYTDNDGDSWTQNPVGCGIGAAVDHQTVGGGPYAAGATGVGVGYPDITYYCAQAILSAQCAASHDGGLTFGPGVPIYTAAQCGGLHGHIVVAPDGTAYVPNADCGGKQGVAVSTDNGVTWAIRTVPGSATQDESDPAVGVGSGNTMYFGFQQASTQKGVNETYPGVAVSHDRGATFTNVNLNLGSGLGIRNVQFPTLIAGDDNRAAFSFLGTTTGGDDQASTFAGVWHLYVATTYDGGATWTTVQATPSADPVQRGCIWLGGGSNTCRNLLDFIGSTVDKTGRVLVGYADGCNDTCASGGKNNWGADATIARQTSGNGLFAAYDGGATGGGTPSASASPTASPTASPAPSATAPSAPQSLTAAAAKGKGVQLTWSAPASDGGAPVTGYTVYRSSGGGAETAVTTVTATSYKDASASGGTYTYTVTATNSAGESPHSNAATATGK